MDRLRLGENARLGRSGADGAAVLCQPNVRGGGGGLG